MSQQVPIKSHSRSGANLPSHLLKAVTSHDLACLATVYGLDAADKTPQELADAISGDTNASRAALSIVSDPNRFGKGYCARTAINYLNQDRPRFIVATIATSALWAVIAVLVFLVGVDKDGARALKRGKSSICWRGWMSVIMLGLLAFALVWIMLWQENTPRYSNRNKQAQLLKDLVIKGTGGNMSALHLLAVHTLSPGDIFTRDMTYITKPRALVFPADHDMHLDWPVEWWYFAINMEADGQPCSVLLLIMRQRVSGLDKAAQVYSVTGSVTLGNKRISKLFPCVVQGMSPLVQHGSNPTRMTVGSLGFVSHSTDPDNTIFPASFTYLDGHANVSLHLTLNNNKYPKDGNRLLQFNNGFVAKPIQNTGLGQYYYSYPNVDVSGQIITSDASMPLSGTAWIDHQGGGNGSNADYRLPPYWTRVLAGMASLSPAKTVLDKEGGSQWHWFAIHMKEKDGSMTHLTLTLRAFAPALADARLFPGDMAGKMFVESTGEFIDIGETNLRVDRVEPGTLQSDKAVVFPTQWTVRILAPASAARTIQLRVQTGEDPCDMYFGAPNVFAEAPADVWWAPNGKALSSLTGSPNGVAFCETVGAGGPAVQFVPFLDMLGFTSKADRSVWIEDVDE